MILVNKKGFTLVELIGVITLLAIIALITVPIINSSIKKSNEKIYNEQISSIINGAKKWVVVNGPKNDTSFTITLEELVDSQIIENDKVIDPRDDTNMLAAGACVIVRYVATSSTYTYSFLATCSE